MCAMGERRSDSLLDRSGSGLIRHQLIQPPRPRGDNDTQGFLLSDSHGYAVRNGAQHVAGHPDHTLVSRKCDLGTFPIIEGEADVSYRFGQIGVITRYSARDGFPREGRRPDPDESGFRRPPILHDLLEARVVLQSGQQSR